MNHELIMLRGVYKMKKSAKQLDRVINKIALNSYNTFNWKDGTMGQVEAITNYISERDNMNDFCDTAISALQNTPKPYRALLVEVYFKNADKAELGKKYNVSPSTVYRKLAKARDSYKVELDKLGCDKDTFCQKYCKIDWVNTWLTEKNGSCGRPEL